MHIGEIIFVRFLHLGFTMRLSTSLASLAYAVFVTLTPAPASAAIDTSEPGKRHSV